MNDKLSNEVDDYIGRLVEQDSALRESAKAGLPPIQGVSCARQVAHVAGASSTSAIDSRNPYARSLQHDLARARDGAGWPLLTLELSHQYAQIAQRNIARAGLETVVDIRVAPAMDTLRQLIKESHHRSI